MNQFIKQALFAANNCIYTNRFDEAIKLIKQVQKVDSNNELASKLFNFIEGVTASQSSFGNNWTGESLDQKIIQIFCDQGMGDTIQCIRYLKVLKKEWDCKLILNCHAYHKELKRFIELFEFIDEFNEFPAECDYNTNILSVPSILNGSGVSYPAKWQEIMANMIPNQPRIQVSPKFSNDSFKVGVAYKSNSDNPIAYKKSIPIVEVATLENGINELYSITPDVQKYNMMIQMPLDDLYDTASLIESMDVIVTVDTVTLHLAGTLEKRTLALLPFEADARWGMSDYCYWYPHVELYRQPEVGNWEVPLKQVKNRLAELRNIK